MERLVDPTILREVSSVALSCLEQNHRRMQKLDVTERRGAGPIRAQYWPVDGGFDLSRLGAAIGRNSWLRILGIHGGIDKLAGNKDLIDGLKKNVSIKNLRLESFDLSSGTGREILEGNISKLTTLRLFNCRLDGIERILTRLTCLRLESLLILGGDVHRDILNRIITLASSASLVMLDLTLNNLGRSDCEALATLLQDPSCRLSHLGLRANDIDNNCVIILANALKRNRKLQTLDLYANHAITTQGLTAFAHVLSDPSSIEATYSSNHTLQTIKPGRRAPLPLCVSSLLAQNGDNNKSRVATQKMLHNHPQLLDMDPLLEWGLKALPLVIARLDPLSSAGQDEANVDALKLSVIYDFAKALPAMFVQHVVRVGGKRKRDSDE